MIGFSIVICTYNPDCELLRRLLYAILNFDKDSPSHEVIFVDNNSDLPIKELTFVKEFVAAKSDVRILHESTPGLTAARICGINAASYNSIVFL